MSYEVFALKYRPQRFDDVVGQDSVAETLARAVGEERVAHAFLFCGSRGVGKTSMARILAKSLNCPSRMEGSSEPCCNCEVCRSIAVGEDIDVIEIDGASNRGIENIRDIRENVGYLPSRSPFKIYIIDEVHMLTIQAFNALLKVLEEPPPHVKFIFATTDPNNLPDTILSRCQRHEFRRIDVNDIVKRLGHICERESVTADEDVLLAIARRAEGGMRDSVSMLDQVISYAGSTIALADLQMAVGVLPRQHLERLINAVADGRTEEVLASISDAYESGFDPQELLIQTTACLREFMVFQATGEANIEEHTSFFDALSPRMSVDRTLYILKLFLNVRGDIKLAGCERIQLEVTALKAARSQQLDSLEKLMKRVERLAKEGLRVPVAPKATECVTPAPAPKPGQEKTQSAVSPASKPSPDSAPRPGPSPPPQASPAQEPPTAQPPQSGFHTSASASAGTETEMVAASPISDESVVTLEQVRQGWSQVVESLDSTAGPVPAALEVARPAELKQGRLALQLPSDQRFALDQLQSPAGKIVVQQALTRVFGTKLDVTISLAAASAASVATARADLYEDTAVQKLLEHFDGSIANVEKSDGEGV